MMAREAGEDPWEGELLFGMEVGGLFSKRSKEMSTQNNNGYHNSQSNFKEGIITPTDTPGQDTCPAYRRSRGC